jgi:hypothetical protein
VLLLFLLYGCKEKDLDLIYQEIHPQYEGYATHITIEEDVSFLESLPQKSFVVYIRKIIYHPIAQTISVTYDIYDGSYQNATYLTVGREGYETNQDETYQYRMSSNRTTITTYFHGIDLTEPFHILFGKYDLDDLNPTSKIKAVKTLTFTDDEWKHRQPIKMVTFNFDQPTDFTISNPAFITFDYILVDPSKGVDQVSFVLIESSTKFEVSRLDYSIDDVYRNDFLIEFNNIRFENVAPAVKYDIVVLVSGSDGIDTFTDIPLTVFNHTVGSYHNNEHQHSWHGLYAAITDVTRDGENVLISYIFYSDHTMKNEYGHEPIVNLRVSTLNSMDVIFREDIDPMVGVIEVPYASISAGFYISIYIQEGYDSLTRFMLRSGTF